MMSTASILVATFLVAQIAMAVVARPYQRKVVELVVELRQVEMSAEEREYVESVGRTYMSWRTAIIISLAFLVGLFASGDALDREYAELARKYPVMTTDDRMRALREARFASAISVNVLFGILAVVLRYAFRLKARLHHDAKNAQAMTDWVATSAIHAT